MFTLAWLSKWTLLIQSDLGWDTSNVNTGRKHRKIVKGRNEHLWLYTFIKNYVNLCARKRSEFESPDLTASNLLVLSCRYNHLAVFTYRNTEYWLRFTVGRLGRSLLSPYTVLIFKIRMKIQNRLCICFFCLIFIIT